MTRLTLPPTLRLQARRHLEIAVASVVVRARDGGGDVCSGGGGGGVCGCRRCGVDTAAQLNGVGAAGTQQRKDESSQQDGNHLGRKAAWPQL
jgi:hypothetical protein